MQLRRCVTQSNCGSSTVSAPSALYQAMLCSNFQQPLLPARCVKPASNPWGSTCRTVLARLERSRGLISSAVSQQVRPAITKPLTTADIQVLTVGRRGGVNMRELSEAFPLASFVQLDENGRTLAESPRRQTGAAVSLAFVVTSADTNADGFAAVRDFAQHARSHNAMVAVAMTLPFGFEGARRAQTAHQLAADLSKDADAVVVVKQEKLCGGTGDAMTVAEALAISDRALITSVHAVAQAVAAPMLRRVVSGMEIVQGPEPHSGSNSKARVALLKHMFQTPGEAILGRGLAELPWSASQGASAAAVVAHMVANGVVAAAESPFLDGMLTSAAAVLCCIGLPPHTEPASDSELQQARTVAIQAAHGNLTTLTAGRCPDVAVCCYHRKPTANAGQQLQVEVSLLVIPRGRAPPQQCNGNAHANAQLHSSSGRSPAQQPSQSWPAMSATAAGAPSPSPSNRPASRHVSAASERVQQSAAAASGPDKAEDGQLGDFLLDSLSALSMDLPPKAAQWRKQQRMRRKPPPGVVHRVFGSNDDDAGPGDNQGLLGIFSQRREPSAKSRTLSIVNADRIVSERD